MLKLVAAATVATALIALPAAPSFAQEKKSTPQQQKMKDCGAKWQAYKKEKNVKGRAEYRKFTSTCLKG